MIMPMLAVKDFAATKKFYSEILGFNVDFTMPDQTGGEAFGIFSWGKANLGAGIDPSGESAGHKLGAGVEFMIYTPDNVDIDQLRSEVEARGGQVSEIKTQYWGDRTFTINDPDGYVITLAKTVKQMSNEEILAADAAQRTTANG